MRDDARRYARRICWSSSDVFLRGRGSQLGMLQWGLAEKRGRKAPRRSRSAMDGYECNLLLICRGVETRLFFCSWEVCRLESESESGERAAGLATQHRREGRLPAIRLRPNAVRSSQRSARREKGRVGTSLLDGAVVEPVHQASCVGVGGGDKDRVAVTRWWAGGIIVIGAGNAVKRFVTGRGKTGDAGGESECLAGHTHRAPRQQENGR